MKRFVYYFMLIGLLGVTASCVEEVDSPVADSEAGKVSFIIEDFIPEGQTKSAAQITGTEIKFQWSENDIIGIFPEDGWQTQFNIENGAGGNVAVFDGGSWGLKQDATYYAYYPFSKDNFESMEKREQVRYSYEGQEACFADENGVVDLSKYDFMASGAGTVENGNVNFNFKHLGALCKITFEAPATATYSHVIIEAEDAVFSMNGYYDATDKDADGTIALIGDSDKTNQFTLSFPSSHNSFNISDMVELYFLMSPVDLGTQNLKLKLIDTDFNYYDADIASKNIEAGKSYGWDIEIKAAYSSFDKETANCYIISESGSYSFPTVEGNGTAYVGDVTSAEVLWESFGTDVVPAKGDLIAKVSYKDKQISFSTPGNFTEGNAVIAAKDANGNILWSWHIWLTDKPQDQVYNNNAGVMMDRNIGATSTVSGDVSALGLLYQWGRKDPFLCSSSISTDLRAASTLDYWSTAYSSETNGTIAYALAHPTTFIDWNNKNYDWFYSGDSTTDDTRWQTVKTIYDPCPAGYRVPDGGDTGIWATAFGISGSFDENAYDSNDEGFNFGRSDITKSLTAEAVCWYPASGCSNGIACSLINTGYDGTYWSATPIGRYAYCLYVNMNGVVKPSCYDNLYRSNGHSVRCQKE